MSLWRLIVTGISFGGALACTPNRAGDVGPPAPDPHSPPDTVSLEDCHAGLRDHSRPPPEWCGPRLSSAHGGWIGGQPRNSAWAVVRLGDRDYRANVQDRLWFGANFRLEFRKKQLEGEETVVDVTLECRDVRRLYRDGRFVDDCPPPREPASPIAE